MSHLGLIPNSSVKTKQNKTQQRILSLSDSCSKFHSSGVTCISHSYQCVTNGSEPWFFRISVCESHLEPMWLVKFSRQSVETRTWVGKYWGCYCCYCYLGTSESPGLMAACKTMASKGFQVFSKLSSASQKETWGSGNKHPRYESWALLNLRSRPEVCQFTFSLEAEWGRNFMWNSPFLPQHQVRPWKRNTTAVSSSTDVLFQEKLNSHPEDTAQAQRNVVLGPIWSPGLVIYLQIISSLFKMPHTFHLPLLCEEECPSFAFWWITTPCVSSMQCPTLMLVITGVSLFLC